MTRGWTTDEALALIGQPFNDLLHRAQTVHRAHFDPNRIEIATLLSIKTGACPEDCAYCPQSAHYSTGVAREALMEAKAVTTAARRAKDAGATRFCMGAAWRSPTDRDLDRVCRLVSEVKTLGLETCVTLGMLTEEQARRLKAAGLDFYNHNIDTSPKYYREIITTRQFAERIETLDHVRAAGLSVCCGGIVGMGEARTDRAGMLVALATLPQHPESVPINLLVRVAGTPLNDAPLLDPLELVRTIAVARIMMPKSVVRLSAGREEMDEAVQALCFLAGANSLFYGEKLLTTPNPDPVSDRKLLEKLGITAAR